MSFALSRYQTTQVATASPLELVISLYDGALRFLREAVAADQAGEIAHRCDRLNRAHAIVDELLATLDASKAPELCAQLASLYEFVLHTISTCVREGTTEGLEPATRVLASLRDGWVELRAARR